MELKQYKAGGSAYIVLSSNRTFMELKYLTEEGARNQFDKF